MNADSSGRGRAVVGAVLGGTAGDGWGRAAAYDAYADGLHTYGLWHLRDHDAAADALYCAFVAADRNHTNLRQPDQIQPWLYALLRRECRLRASEGDPPKPISDRLRPKPETVGGFDAAASLLQLEGNLRRAEFQSLAWHEAEGLAPAHREVLELTIRHGLDSRGLALVLGLREGAAGLAPSHGFGLLADAWRELERSLAAAAVASSGRDNCAQLAELTFGWSGKFSSTLRGPLTGHVDGCSRCQHYLHTVIGTPSAPTILPYVAAPRALRELLLGELSDLDAARDAGVDIEKLGERCGSFGSDGFPARIDHFHAPASPSAGAGRAPKRRQPGGGRAAQASKTGSAGSRPQTVHKASVRTPPAGSPIAGTPAEASGTAIVRPREPGMKVRPRPTEPEDLFYAKGSWAGRVLPPQNPGPDGAPEFWRPEPEPGFVHTLSGRFATRPPTPSAKQPATPGTRRRHKARPMRQAVLSAMALGAIGAVAATAAAMLGANSNPNSNTTALDGAPKGDPLALTSTRPSTADPHGHLSVSVSAGITGAPVPAGLGGLSPSTVSRSADTSSPTPTTASSGAFYVSVNQRASDPESVQILLRNAGTGPLHWSANPTVSWLSLSQSSGTLAGGASLSITASASGSAPAGEWSAQIVFQPGGIVVTLHGGIPVGPPSPPTTNPPTTTPPSTPPPTTTPSNPSPTPTPTNPGPTPSATSQTPTQSSSAGTSRAGSPSGTSATPEPTTTATSTAKSSKGSN